MSALLCPAQQIKVLYNFGGPDPGGLPIYVTLTQGRDGALYGTSSQDSGNVFRLTTQGQYSQLYAFSSGPFINPEGGVTLGADGNFYGTTQLGGVSYNFGGLFQLTPAGVFTDLYEFNDFFVDSYPAAPPILASDGNFYGTTVGVGTDGEQDGAVVYRYMPSDGSTTILYTSYPATGAFLWGPVQGTDGNLYATAQYGGPKQWGNIFEMSLAGDFIFDHGLTGPPGPAAPFSGLIQGSDGNFYGTSSEGGTSGRQGHGEAGFGTVYKMDTSNTVTALYSFPSEAGGYFPVGALTEGTDGYLYGTTSEGGPDDGGTLFRISTSGSYERLGSFTYETGIQPLGALMQHTNGVFYGTTRSYGANGPGTVYSLDMGLAPFVAFVQPTGEVGATAQILGQGFNHVTAVSFNGVPATTFAATSDTYLIATVPSGATTGPVTVTTSTGTLTSNKSFQVLP
jgi:uncharacterized repeat protein (TIGR03803 family)